MAGTPKGTNLDNKTNHPDAGTYDSGITYIIWSEDYNDLAATANNLYSGVFTNSLTVSGTSASVFQGNNETLTLKPVVSADTYLAFRHSDNSLKAALGHDLDSTRFLLQSSDDFEIQVGSATWDAGTSAMVIDNTGIITNPQNSAGYKTGVSGDLYWYYNGTTNYIDSTSSLWIRGTTSHDLVFANWRDMYLRPDGVFRIQDPSDGNVSVWELATSSGSRVLTVGNTGGDLVNQVFYSTSVRQYASAPFYRWFETDAAVDNGVWDIIINGEAFYIRTVNDAESVAANAFFITRTGTTVDTIVLAGTNNDVGQSGNQKTFRVWGTQAQYNTSDAVQYVYTGVGGVTMDWRHIYNADDAGDAWWGLYDSTNTGYIFKFYPYNHDKVDFLVNMNILTPDDAVFLLQDMGVVSSYNAGLRVTHHLDGWADQYVSFEVNRDGVSWTDVLLLSGATSAVFNPVDSAGYWTGSGNSLGMYHDGSDGYITSVGGLFIDVGTYRLEIVDGGTYPVIRNPDGGVVGFNDAVFIYGASGGLSIYNTGGTDAIQISHDGTDANIDTTNTTDININLDITVDGGIHLLNDSSNKFEPISVYGEGINTTANYGMMLWNDNGTSGDWGTAIFTANQGNRRIWFLKQNSAGTPTTHADFDVLGSFDGDDSSFNLAGNLTLSGASTPTIILTDTTTPATVELKVENTDARLGTTTAHAFYFKTGDTIRASFDTSGHFKPYVANTYDLGSTSLEWRDLFLAGRTYYGSAQEASIRHDASHMRIANATGNILISTPDTSGFIFSNATGSPTTDTTLSVWGEWSGTRTVDGKIAIYGAETAAYQNILFLHMDGAVAKITAGSSANKELQLIMNATAVAKLTTGAEFDLTNSKLLIGGSGGTSGYFLQTDGSGNVSWATASGSGDNLGDHTATEALKMATFNINNVGNLYLGNQTTHYFSNIGTGQYRLYSTSGSYEAGIWFQNLTTGTTNTDGFEVSIDTAEQPNIMNHENTNMFFGTNKTWRWYIQNGGHLIPYVDNTYDIGTSTVAVRSGYFGTAYVGAATTYYINGSTSNLNSLTLVTQLNVTSTATTDGIAFGGGTVTYMNQISTGYLRLYKADASLNYLSFQNSITGTTTGDGFRVGLTSAEEGELETQDVEDVNIGTSSTTRTYWAGGSANAYSVIHWNPSTSNVYDMGTSSVYWDELYADNFNNMSSARWKENIVYFDDINYKRVTRGKPANRGLFIINQLKPVMYRREKVKKEYRERPDKIKFDKKGNPFNPYEGKNKTIVKHEKINITDENGNFVMEKKWDYGLVAEDVDMGIERMILDRIISYDENGLPTGLSYMKIIPIMIQAIRELSAEVEELKAKQLQTL
jgi:hypothetical protein